jgi:hypothetical protein
MRGFLLRHTTGMTLAACGIVALLLVVYASPASEISWVADIATIRNMVEHRLLGQS